MRGQMSNEFYLGKGVESKDLESLNSSYGKYIKLADKHKNPIGQNDLISVDPISNVAKINPKYQYLNNSWQSYYNRTDNPQFSRKKAGFMMG